MTGPHYQVGTSWYLTRLEKLTFRPMAQCLDERAAVPNATEAEMDARACTTLNAILRKCSGRLEELEVEANSPLTWPTEDFVPLPELKRLALDHIDSNTGALSKLLSLSPTLQHFELRGTHWADDRNEETTRCCAQSSQ